MESNSLKEENTIPNKPVLFSIIIMHQQQVLSSQVLHLQIAEAHASKVLDIPVQPSRIISSSKLVNSISKLPKLLILISIAIL